MPDSELKDTQPTPASGETQPSSLKQETKPRPAGKRFPRWLAALVVVLLLIIGALAGYGFGMGQRYDAQHTQVTGQLQEQFDLGIQKMNAGQYELARQHFEFIIQHDSNFPGVMDAYTDLLLRMQISPTPTASSTPTITPTPDLRSADAIYANVRGALASRDWDSALTNLDSLRKTAPAYRIAEVDGMYYLALRMRGFEKIVPPSQTCSDVNLEGGIYDFNLAERFGTLDSYAQSLRTYARLYIVGSSYWDQDWITAQDYFNQVMSGYPALSDSSCMSATERLRFATIKYAEQLLAAGDTCGAQEQFDLAFTISSLKNEEFFPTATEVYVQCHGDDGGDGGDQTTPEGTLTETPTPTPTETPTP
jgi:hypothetical protein